MTLQPDDRIELIEMPADPNPVPVGATGTVKWVSHFDSPHPYDQVGVSWDNGRSLMLLIPPDRVRVLPTEERPR